MKRFKRSAGIAIGPILFVVAILAVLVAAIASGSGGFGSSTADEAARTRAGVIIEQSINIKNAVARMAVNGGDPTTFIVSETPTTTSSILALYGPSGGGITIQYPPKEAVVSGASWRFARNVDLPLIGGSGGDFITIIEVPLAICNAINDLLFGKGTYTTPPTLGTSPTVTIAAAGAGDIVTPSSNAFALGGSPDAAFNARGGACGANGTSNYYYYQLLTAG